MGAPGKGIVKICMWVMNTSLSTKYNPSLIKIKWMAERRSIEHTSDHDKQKDNDFEYTQSLGKEVNNSDLNWNTPRIHTFINAIPILGVNPCKIVTKTMTINSWEETRQYKVGWACLL